MSTIRFVVLGGLLTLLTPEAGTAQAEVRRVVTSAGTEATAAEEALVREFPDALIYKGFYLYVAGDHLEAARTWESYLDAAPNGDTTSVIQLIEETYGREFPDWLVYRGFALFQAGDFHNAERVWSRYLELAPADADRQSVRALIAKAHARASEQNAIN